MRKQTISKSKAVELIQNSKGRFFTVDFVKKDNSQRTINCNYKIPSKPSKLGYIMVYSMKDKGYKNINPQTIKNLTINNINYKVR